MISFIGKYLLAGSAKNATAPFIVGILLFFYAISAVYCALLFPDHLVTQLILNTIMVVSYITMERSPLGVDKLAFLSPLLLITILTIGAVFFHGDFLIFVYTIGGAMISLTYLSPRGTAIYIIGIFAVQAFLLFALGRNILGANFTQAQSYLGFFGAAMLNSIIYLFCRSYTKTLASLTEARNAASQLAQAKSTFLAKMSHEIRTPMNAIIGISQIELQKEALPPANAGALEKIYSASKGLLGIINDVLDLSKIESGRFALSPHRYNLPNLISDTVQLNMMRIGQKPIDFVLQVDPHLPLTLCGDALRLRQILDNLISNAVKYTEKGYVKLSVGRVTEPDRFLLSFAVEDTGLGIPAEDQAMLFAEYFRINTRLDSANEGTGLGLNITKQLVDLMGGKIAVQSAYGKGSKFTVTLEQEEAEGCGVIGEELAGRLQSFSHKNEQRCARPQIVHQPAPRGKVLVVDDIEINLYVTEGLLAPYQLDVHTAANGFAAVDQILSGSQYDIIFMDHMMPLMDGIETVQKLRAFHYTGAIVALTANALTGNAEMFAQSGFDGFISKPIDVEELDRMLRKFIPTAAFDCPDPDAGGHPPD